MKQKKLQTATAIALTAMYLVVGLGGESLHYLVDSAASHLLSSQVTDAEATDTEATEAEVLAEAAHHHGYHHFHGPDFHVHYHGPAKTKRAGKQAYSTSQVAKQKNRDSGAAYHEPGEQHQPHACPLLAVCSALELSQVGLAGWFLEVPTCTQIESETQTFALCEFARLHQPRGPPTCRIV